MDSEEITEALKKITRKVFMMRRLITGTIKDSSCFFFFYFVCCAVIIFLSVLFQALLLFRRSELNFQHHAWNGWGIRLNN